MFVRNCTSSNERSNKSRAIVRRYSRWSSVSKRGTNFAHTCFMCRSSVKIASHESTEIPQSSAISRTVSLLLLRTIVLTLAIISSFLDVEGRPAQGSISAEVLPSSNRRNQSNTCVRPIAPSPLLAAIIDSFRCGFTNFKTTLDANALFGTFTHRKNRYDINARVISATHYSQLSTRNHLQLVS